jgi:uncharacterized cupredoxin-like copper-binding protein
VKLRPRAAAALAAAAALLALAGCGEKKETTTGAGAATAAAPRTVKVSETEFKLTPASPNVPKAGAIEVQVRNDGSTEHALEIEAPGGEVKTDPIAPGKSATLKVDLKAGSYEWYCPIDGHRGKGMSGTLSVAGGGSDSGGDSGGSGGGDDKGGGYSRGGGY